MKGGAKPPQGLRINGEKKYQILRAFEDEEAGCYVVYGKKVETCIYFLVMERNVSRCVADAAVQLAILPLLWACLMRIRATIRRDATQM